MKTIRKTKLTNYSYIHQWNSENHVKSGVCRHCGLEKKTEWALIHGKEHARGIENYLELCKKCHIAYDRTVEWDNKKLESLKKTPNHLKLIKPVPCEECLGYFKPVRKSRRFCSNSCAAKVRMRIKLALNKNGKTT